MTEPASTPPFVFVPPTIEATAHHEAGHAFVAVATGLFRVDGPIVYLAGKEAHVPIVMREDRIHAWCGAGGTVDQCKELMAVAYAAGTEAERLYLIDEGKTPDDRQLFGGAHGDIKMVAEFFGPGRWNEYRAKARPVLEQPAHWQAVKTLAAALLASWPAPLSAGEAMTILAAVAPACPVLAF